MRLAHATRVLGLVVAVSAPETTLAQQPLPYKEGQVINVAFVRTKPGKFNDYMRYVMGPYKQLLDAQKQAGIVVDWWVATAAPQSPDEPDIILYTTYTNMAALDNLTERNEPVAQRVMGSMQLRDQAAIDREALRTVIGSRLIRVLVPR